MKIVAYCICKNEQNNITNFLKTIEKFDDVYILDTGSTDNTVQILKDYGLKVEQKIFEEFDFSEARNACLSLVPPNTWSVYLDFNEYLHDGWREQFEQDISNNPEANAFTFERYDDYEGNLVLGSEQYYIRAHLSDQYCWKNAVHELLVEVKERKVAQSSAKLSKIIQRSFEKEKFYFQIARNNYEKTQNIFYLWHVINFYYRYFRSDYTNDEVFEDIENIIDNCFSTEDKTLFSTDAFIRILMLYVSLGLLRAKERKIECEKSIRNFLMFYEYFDNSLYKLFYAQKLTENDVESIQRTIKKEHLFEIKKNALDVMDYISNNIHLMGEEFGIR